MNYYEHHIGDYAKDAGYLSMTEDGAFRRLLDAYYTRESALPASAKDCCKLARATTKAERDAVVYVLGEFFELRADGYHQKRCDEEIDWFQTKSEKARRSANARWSAMQNDCDGNANASKDAMRTHMRTHSEGNAPRARPQSPVTSNQEELRAEEREKPNAPAAPSLNPGTPASEPKKPKRAGMTLAAWLESLPPEEMAIPADDPVYAYAERVGLPDDFLRLQWAWFKAKYLAEPKTRQADWRQKFRNAVEGGWGNHWRIDSNGAYYLTTQGKQLERSLSEVTA